MVTVCERPPATLTAPWTADAPDLAMPDVGTPSAPTADEVLRQAYTEHRAAVFTYVLFRTGGDRGWAEDVVQETMLRCWMHADRLRTGPALRGWLYTVAGRIALDGRRRRLARPQEVPAEHDEPADDAAEPLLTALAVREALLRLSVPHRQVLVELYYRDRSLKDTAAALGVPLGTVKSRAFQALRALRAALERPGGLLAAGAWDAHSHFGSRA